MVLTVLTPEEILNNGNRPRILQVLLSGHLRRTIADSVGKQSQRKRRVLSDIYGSEIFLSRLAPHPTNPYFVTKINPKRRSEFYIPKQLMRHGNIELAEKIIFEDPSGRQWIGNRQTWNNSRVFYTKGWRPLCECNSVQDDDLCICEFTKDEDGTNFINVSFVRGGY
ncbi:transcriptional factor B3 family protein [Striga asiatica]|uniref:Transcriptional factor B3 family protein n=1 Tax=Striga asiatica TaxID=4170 RepID=A0A5A7PVM0_STRAF|nr:transcriptional factor B3 family protein [Striga asiatica]